VMLRVVSFRCGPSYCAKRRKSLAQAGRKDRTLVMLRGASFRCGPSYCAKRRKSLAQQLVSHHVSSPREMPVSQRFLCHLAPLR
jgi:hypothetical protein